MYTATLLRFGCKKGQRLFPGGVRNLWAKFFVVREKTSAFYFLFMRNPLGNAQWVTETQNPPPPSVSVLSRNSDLTNALLLMRTFSCERGTPVHAPLLQLEYPVSGEAVVQDPPGCDFSNKRVNCPESDIKRRWRGALGSTGIPRL